MPVRKTNYREVPTPGGLESMENGTLEWFDTEMYGNLNTGLLEEYLDEKARKGEFLPSPYVWRNIALGIAIGTIFAVITEYVGLKVGIAISGGWYVIYLTGMAMKWKPTEINLMAAAGDAATMICTGFIFTFPAMYLLAYDPTYALTYDQQTGEYAFLITKIPPIFVPMIATIVSGWLGVMYFIIFRRLWLVEDPLHLPGFEPLVKLLDISKDRASGAFEQARRSIRIIMVWSLGTALFTFLRDFPVIKVEGAYKSLMDYAFEGPNYSFGEVGQDPATAQYTYVSFAVLPIQIGIGWFMKFRVALLMSLGSFLTWFIVVPMAVAMDVPIFDLEVGGFVKVSEYFFASWVAYRKIGTIIGIGAILGGGFFAIFKMMPMFVSAMKDVSKAVKGEGSTDYIPSKGWFEWPLSHIPIMVIVTLVMVTIVFIIGGYPAGPSAIFSTVLVAATFFLGAIAVKTMGETGTEPVSATSIIVLLMLIGLFKGLSAIFPMPDYQIAVMAIIGTTVFAGAISMSGSIILDFKIGGYTGNRLYHLMRGVVTGLLPGAVVAAIAAGFFSYNLAIGKLDLLAPQAKVFATLVQIIFSGQSNEQVLMYLGIGVGIGIFAELTTGMGTAFGLGMYFPLAIQLPFLVGGALRDIWEMKYLEPTCKREKWSEKKKTLKVLDTYMMATGLMIGEAIMATMAAIALVLIGG